jgi:hypothetical protein
VTIYDLAERVYSGHSFTTWHKDHWRSSANYQIGQHLGLDMDTEDERSSLPVLIKDEFVSKYAAFLYTTPSHLPEKPRCRVVFLLDSPIQQAKNYALAASALLWAFGSADRACVDPCRFFYGSKECDMEFAEHVLPLDVVKKLIARYKETGDREKRRHSNYVNTNTDMAEVDDALKRINPWGIDYSEWIQVLMALHHTYGDTALPLAVSWGQGEGDEIERKWPSFRPQSGQAQVGLGTIFLIAKRFGWEKKQDFLKSDWKAQ